MATATITVELESYLETRPSVQHGPTNDVTLQAEGSGRSHPPQILQGLEPADGGPSAWKLLFGAFCFEAIIWGKACRSLSM